MFTEKNVRKRLSFLVTLALSAGGAASIQTPSAYAAEIHVAVSDDRTSDVIGSTTENGNKVTIGAAGGGAHPVIKGSIIGGDTRDAAKNLVDIKSVLLEAPHAIYGGRGANSASENTVNLAGGTVASIYGGYTKDGGTGETMRNTVTVTGGTVTGDFMTGGYAAENTTGAVQENTATMSGGQTESLAGGISNGSGAVTNNAAALSGGTAKYMLGGFSREGNAAGNTANITGGTVTDAVFGANVQGNGAAMGNTVTLTSGTTAGIIGGLTAKAGHSTGNAVTITGGKTTQMIHGGYTEEGGSAIGNTVTVTGGTVADAVHGGTTALAGNAIKNLVAFQGGKTGNLVGGCTNESGNAKDNTVTITGGTLTGSAYGGKAEGTGNATGNHVNVRLASTAQQINGLVVGGTAAAPTSAITGNSVTFEGGSIGIRGAAVGGLAAASHTGDLKNNTFTLKGGEVSTGAGAVAQGASGTVGGDSADDGNHAIVEGGKAYFGIYGGVTVGTGKVSHNTLTISGGEVELAAVGGGHRASNIDSTADITRNSVTITGGSIKGFVHGGVSDGAGTVAENTVTITGGTLAANDDDSCTQVYGGYVRGNGTATHNTVNLGDTAHRDLVGANLTKGDIYGGNKTDVTGNTLNIYATNAVVNSVNNFENYHFKLHESFKNNDAMLSVKDAGSFGGTGVDWRKITADRSDLSAAYVTNVHGVHRVVLIKSAAPNALKLNNYSTTIYDATDTHESRLRTDTRMDTASTVLYEINRFKGGRVTYDGTRPATDSEVYGGISYDGHTATDNQLTITNLPPSLPTNAITAAYGGKSTSGAGGNSVTVTSTGAAKIGSIYGGYTAGTGTATGNKVTFSGGATLRDLMGGCIENTSSHADAADNTVTITDGDIGGSIYGGYTSGTGKTTGNTVNFYSGAVTGALYGGYAANGEASGNIVNLGAVNTNAEIYGGSGQATNGNIVNLFGTKIANMVTGGTAANSKGNVLAIRTTGTEIRDFTGFQNLRFYLPETANSSTATMLKLGIQNKSIKGLGIGLDISGTAKRLQKNDVFSLIKVDAGGTLTTDEKIESEVMGTQGVSLNYKFRVQKKGEDELIAAVESVEMNSATKSLAETRAAATDVLGGGTNLLADAGISSAVKEAASANVQTGAYTSWASQGGSSMRIHSGSYVDTHGYTLNVGFARKQEGTDGALTYGPFVEYGRASYDSYLEDAAGTYGNGKIGYVGAGFLARQDWKSGFYLEGSVRGGRIKSDYTGVISEKSTSYDTSNPYYALHLGIGKTTNLKAGNSIETYLKYFYSHQDSTSAKLSTGEDYEFGAVNSHRLRLGARYTHDMGAEGRFYAGLAWEYEFEGEARATYQGMSTPSPSLKGSSAMLEIGCRFAPKDSRVSYDVNISGWQGKRKGFTGSIGIHWTF